MELAFIGSLVAFVLIAALYQKEREEQAESEEEALAREAQEREAWAAAAQAYVAQQRKQREELKQFFASVDNMVEEATSH